MTKDTLDRLQPKGSDLSKGAQVIRIGKGTARPDGFKTAVIEGADPYARAAAIDRFYSAARGKPSTDVLVVSGEKPEWAMPAAAWGARSGDAVLPVKRDSVPAPIAKALREHSKPNIYVLGPEGRHRSQGAGRAGPARQGAPHPGPTPVQNAIAFARYQRGGFGWGVVVPGYNFTVASTDRPGDTAAAASLATRGVFAPLLLTDRRRRAAAAARDLPAERAARLRGRPGPGRLQPRLGARGRQDDLGEGAGPDGRDHRAGAGPGQRAVARYVSGPVSEYEQPERLQREPTVEDVRQLMGASTPHFALQLRNRIDNLIHGLPPEHPARVEGEREIARLDRLAWGSERRGPIQEHEEGLPSFPPDAEENGDAGH